MEQLLAHIQMVISLSGCWTAIDAFNKKKGSDGIRMAPRTSTQSDDWL